MRISDWSSDVCSSDLHIHHHIRVVGIALKLAEKPIRSVYLQVVGPIRKFRQWPAVVERLPLADSEIPGASGKRVRCVWHHRLHPEGHTDGFRFRHPAHRSEEHTSELQSLMRISYAV